MMDCDQATLSREEERRWSGINDSIPLLREPVMNDFPSLFVGTVGTVR